MSKSPNLGLNLTPVAETLKLFRDWRGEIDGDTPASNMMILDKTIGEHVNNTEKHVTTAKQNAWDAKETPNGAQAKANAAETNAKNASIPLTQKGVANGVAPLDANSIVPLQHLPSPIKEMQVVADIAARNAIAVKFSGLSVFVKNATADATVKTGGATYIYDGSIWSKTGEAESMDVVLSWGNIVEKPTVFPPSAHTHTAAEVGAATINHTHDDRYYTEAESLSPATKIKLGLATDATPDMAWEKVGNIPSLQPGDVIYSLDSNMPRKGFVKCDGQEITASVMPQGHYIKPIPYFGNGYGVSFLNGKIVNNGKGIFCDNYDIYKTNDFGKTVTKLPRIDNNFSPRKVNLLNDGHGVVIGSAYNYASGAYYTENYGQTWVSSSLVNKSLGLNLFLYSTGVCMTENYISFDFGKTFNVREGLFNLGCLYLLENGKGIWNDTNSGIYYTTNNWTTVTKGAFDNGDPSSFNFCTLSNTGYGIISGNSGTYCTLDFGKTWTTPKTPFPAEFDIGKLVCGQLNDNGKGCFSATSPSKVSNGENYVFYTNDGGQTLQQSIGYGHTLTFDGMDSTGRAIGTATKYKNSAGYLAYSDDYGAHWEISSQISVSSPFMCLLTGNDGIFHGISSNKTIDLKSFVPNKTNCYMYVGE